MHQICHQLYARHAGCLGVESQHGLAAHTLILRKKQTFSKVGSGICVNVQGLLQRLFVVNFNVERLEQTIGAVMSSSKAHFFNRNLRPLVVDDVGKIKNALVFHPHDDRAVGHLGNAKLIFGFKSHALGNIFWNSGLTFGCQSGIGHEFFSNFYVVKVINDGDDFLLKNPLAVLSSSPPAASFPRRRESSFCKSMAFRCMDSRLRGNDEISNEQSQPMLILA